VVTFKQIGQGHMIFWLITGTIRSIAFKFDMVGKS